MAKNLPVMLKNDYPLQYSCLENSMDRVAWLALSMGLQGVGYDWATNTSTFKN